MSWKIKYRCTQCGYEASDYEGRGLFRQQIISVSCPDCKSIQNLVVGGIIGDVAPSFNSEVGRLCLQCRERVLDIGWVTAIMDIDKGETEVIPLVCVITDTRHRI